MELAISGGTPVRNKPFPSWPVFDDREIRALEMVVQSGIWAYDVASNKLGRRAQEFGNRFAARQDARFGLCVANGSAALEVALIAAGIGPGDEVITSPLTFVATVAAIMRLNATPVLADVEPETYCLDPHQIEVALTPRTRAIIPVHLGGCLADMDAIIDLADRHNLVVIEDCAHVAGAKWRGKGIGSHGHLGCFSFQSTKPMTCGEGGLILTSSSEFEERCHTYLNCGRLRDGDIFRPSLLGWNYRLSEFQAAVLLVQLQRLDEQIARREQNAKVLVDGIASIPGLKPLRLDPRVTQRQFYQITLRYDANQFDGIPRERFIAALNAEGIPTSWSYVPLHRDWTFFLEQASCRLRDNPYLASDTDYSQLSFPVAERAAYQEAINFDHSLLLGEPTDIQDILTAIHKIWDYRHELL